MITPGIRVIFKSVRHFRQAHRPSGGRWWRSGGETESNGITRLCWRCWWGRGAGVNAAGYRRRSRRCWGWCRGTFERKRCVAADWGHGRQGLFVCENSERIERRRVLWIVRHVFNLLPRAGIRPRIGACDRENERRSRKNLVRFCAFLRQRAFAIIECQNRIALARSDLTSKHDVDRRWPAVLCQQHFDLLGRDRQFTGHKRSSDVVAAVFESEAIRVVHFLPPLKRCGAFSRAVAQPRNCTPTLRFAGAQQVRVACLSISFIPLFPVD